MKLNKLCLLWHLLHRLTWSQSVFTVGFGSKIFSFHSLSWITCWKWIIFIWLKLDWKCQAHYNQPETITPPNKCKFCVGASWHDLPGRYSSLAALIWISVSAAICSFWVTSSAVRLVLPRTRIRLSSSTSEPYKEIFACQKMDENGNITHEIATVMEFRIRDIDGTDVHVQFLRISVHLTLFNYPPCVWVQRPTLIALQTNIF